MIADSIQNKGLYSHISPELASALNYVTSVKAEGFTEQTVELNGRKLFAMHQSYVTETSEGRQFEAHRRYIDVQYIVEGEEVILAAELSCLESRSVYDEDKDVQWFMPGNSQADASTGNASVIRLKAGQFAVFYPRDAHMPKISNTCAGAVKKVVVKIAV
jgi:YhcH/YjgK/YiaL family protein